MSAHIPDDILDVAAVVLGEQRIRLTGWQRDDAIHAMTALGYSRHHIAWALNTTWQAVYEYARRHNIPTNPRDQHLDWTAINMVVTGTARIHLTGADRDEAIRLMAPRLTAEQISHRLCLAEAKIGREIAKRLGITLREPEQWSWESYLRAGRGARQAVAA